MGHVSIRVYSTHLGTMGDLAPSARRDQLRAIIADAEPYPRVVIGGDMNDVRVEVQNETRLVPCLTSAAPAITWRYGPRHLSVTFGLPDGVLTANIEGARALHFAQL